MSSPAKRKFWRFARLSTYGGNTDCSNRDSSDGEMKGEKVDGGDGALGSEVNDADASGVVLGSEVNDVDASGVVLGSEVIDADASDAVLGRCE